MDTPLKRVYEVAIPKQLSTISRKPKQGASLPDATGSAQSLAAELASMARLQEVSTRLVQAGDGTSLLQEILDAAIAITAAEMGLIQLFDPDSKVFEVVASRGIEGHILQSFAADSITDCVRGLRTGERLVIEDVSDSLVLSGKAREVMTAAGVRAALFTPLIARSGHLVGLLSTHYRIRCRPAECDLHMVDTLARQAADWIERTQAEQAMRQSEQRFRRTFECNMAPMGVWTREGGIVGANDALLEMIGYTREELDSGTINWQQLTPPEHLHLDERALAEIQNRGVCAAFEKEYIHKSGHRIPILVAGAAFTGTADQGIFFAIDLTERKRAEQALLEADRAKSDFLAALSHELRNPLAPIRNGLTILEYASPDSEEARTARAVIGRQVDQLVRLVNDLLDITRISRNKLQLQPERLELGQLVGRTVEDHRSQFQAAGVRLELAGVADPLFVDADRNRLAQALGNLLQNASKFSDRGGLTTITVTPDHGKSRVEIRIADSGVGVTAEVLPRLFQPFVQADNTLARGQGGLGLGLALVKAIVELHGGQINARSDGLGKGTEFVLTLPLAQALPAQQPESRERPAPSSRRVLVIDDNVDAANALQFLLKVVFRVREITVAHTGPEGLEKARAFRPELVLCDIGLPGMDGYAIASAIRADPELRDARLVAVTGYTQPEDVRRAIDAGFEWHVAKPLEVEEMKKILRHLASETALAVRP